MKKALQWALHWLRLVPSTQESQTNHLFFIRTDGENFEIDSEGNITSKVAFDYETQKILYLQHHSTDGTNSTTSLTITLSDVNESPDVKITFGSELLKMLLQDQL